MWAAYTQYKYIIPKMYIPQLCAREGHTETHQLTIITQVLASYSLLDAAHFCANSFNKTCNDLLNCMKRGPVDLNLHHI